MIDMRHFSILVVVTIRLFLCCYAATSTELVEEWGCYDSEFKLTCNHIESTVGILEATFTPNCVGSNGKSNKLCLLLIQNYDEGQNSIMKIIAQSLGNKLEQEEELAARKLLEVLRNARLKEQEQEENEARTSEYRSEMFNTTDVYDVATFNDTDSEDYEMSNRSDKRTLRNSLEKLISLYLTKLREDSTEHNIEEENSREKRETAVARFYRRRKLNPGSCRTMRRRIGTLDHTEIEQSLRNFTSNEFNIRKLLNYRCSGKNHCSFIFSNDHPYAMFWEKGTIHIKYFCMDEFRANKYCGELLNIGNEVWPEVRDENADDDDSGERLNEPVAEARTHLELKILKAEKNDSRQPATSPRAKSKTGDSEIKILNVMVKEKPPQNKVYSQDFKITKILHNELPPKSNIKKGKKEENILKKNDDLITPVDLNIETNEIDSILPTDSVSTLATDSLLSKATNATEPFMEIISSIVDPTITSNEIDKILNPTTEGAQIMIVERKDLEKTVTNQPPVEIVNGTDEKSDDLGANEDVTVFSTKDIELNAARERYLNLSNGGTIRGSDLETFHFTDDELDDKNDEADSYEDNDFETLHKPRPTEYSSRQRSMPSSTLLHGFISNPGYPSFYIGKTSDCKWKLKLNDGQRIAITLFDLHLRIDEYCKDSLEIVDVNSRRTLYRGCSELSRPIQVQSTSNSVEIVLRTKSRSIYPKRGFLIHYKAVGCILPPSQSRVILDYRHENFAKFVCEPKHVFPDTSQPERLLHCVNESWNDTLVNCVETEAVNGSGPVNLWFNERLRKEKKMGSSDENMFDDILLPVFIVSALFVLNAVVFVVIIRYRKRQSQESFDRELADL